MNESKLLHEGGRSHFITKRFDRDNQGNKLHMQTLGGLAQMDFKQPREYSYENVFSILRQMQLSHETIEQQFRRMVLNVISRNCDDHVKNISFLMNKNGKWNISPAYDISFSFNPEGDWTNKHQLAVNGKYEQINREDLLKVGAENNIHNRIHIIEQIVDVVSQWKKYAKDSGIEADTIEFISKHHILFEGKKHIISKGNNNQNNQVMEESNNNIQLHEIFESEQGRGYKEIFIGRNDKNEIFSSEQYNFKEPDKTDWVQISNKEYINIYSQMNLVNVVNENKEIKLNKHMESKPTYKHSKFEHFKKCIIDNLNYAENIEQTTKYKFGVVIDSFKETPEYTANPDTYTFSKLKEEIQHAIKGDFIKDFSEVEKQRFPNFIKMAHLKPEREFKVYPTDAQLKEKSFVSYSNDNKPQSKYTFDDFKRNISLPDFMELYGFTEDKRSTSNSRRMRNEGTGELYIVKKNALGKYTFFDPINDAYKGASIIDFVLDRHKHDIQGRPFTFQDASRLLTDYMKGEMYVNPDNSNYKLIQERVDHGMLQKEIKELNPCTKRDFLHKRGISDEIIDSTIFNGRIKNHTYYDEINKIEHVNVAFPIQNEKEIVAISKRNDNFKGVVGEKSKGIFITKDPTNAGKLDKVIIVESGVDALSHYQLNYDQLKDQKVRYISTEGSFADTQVDVISMILNKQQPKELLFGQDNDVAGAHEITMLLSNLKLTDTLKADNSIMGSDMEINAHKSKKECFIEINCHYERLKGEKEFIHRDTFMEKVIVYAVNNNVSKSAIRNVSFSANKDVLFC